VFPASSSGEVGRGARLTWAVSGDFRNTAPLCGPPEALAVQLGGKLTHRPFGTDKLDREKFCVAFGVDRQLVIGGALRDDDIPEVAGGADLARRTPVSGDTVSRREAADGVPCVQVGTLERIRTVFEAEGIEFTRNTVGSACGG
jgi:hypothetical protein